MSKASVTRTTKETQITVKLNIYGKGSSKVNTGINYLDHMITSLSFHSMIDIDLNAKGDFIHHVAEDVGITLGECLGKALGDRKGIHRFGSAIVPMDDSSASVNIDLAKRPYSVVNLKIEKDGVEDMVREDIEHFVRSLATALQSNIHINVQYGENDHHKTEAAFKALALSLRMAMKLDPQRMGTPSSKGMI